MKWNDPTKVLPETEPNTDGQVCAVITEDGNVYRARYMHDVPNEGAEAKYWSEFTIDHCGRENEHYEISEKVILWTPLPSTKGAEVDAKGQDYYKERLYWALRSSKTKKTQLNWHHAMYTACTGASHGYQLCVDLGVDPDGTEFVKPEVSVGEA